MKKFHHTLIQRRANFALHMLSVVKKPDKDIAKECNARFLGIQITPQQAANQLLQVKNRHKLARIERLLIEECNAAGCKFEPWGNIYSSKMVMLSIVSLQWLLYGDNLLADSLKTSIRLMHPEIYRYGTVVLGKMCSEEDDLLSETIRELERGEGVSKIVTGVDLSNNHIDHKVRIKEVVNLGVTINADFDGDNFNIPPYAAALVETTEMIDAALKERRDAEIEKEREAMQHAAEMKVLGQSTPNWYSGASAIGAADGLKDLVRTSPKEIEDLTRGDK